MRRLQDRWADRDYPVLEWIVAQFDTPDPEADDTTMTAALGISADDAAAAVQNLERGRFLTNVTWAFDNGFAVGNITERALRETGVWPNNEAIADQLLWFVQQKIDDATTPDERSRWEKLRGGLLGAGRDVLVDLAAAIAARSVGA